MRARALLAITLLGLGCQSATLPPKKGAPAPPAVDPASVVVFAAGAFSMGHLKQPQAPYGNDWFLNEAPKRQITLAAFAMDKTEVTVAAYAVFLTKRGGLRHWSPLQPITVAIAADGVLPPMFSANGGAESLPASYVTWFDASAYCAWIGGALPTEAQWERAATGADATQRYYPWGSDAPTCDRVSFFTGDTLCAQGPSPVGSHPTGDTPDGLHDMAGNVAEWTADWYGDYPAGDATDPIGPDTGEGRVIRGGGFHDIPQSLRAAARWPGDPASRSPGVGFRCVYPR